MPQRAIISSRNHLKIALRGDSSPSKPAFRRCLNLRHWFHEGEQAGHADVYAFNALISGYSRCGDLAKAEWLGTSVLKDLRGSKGLEASRGDGFSV